MASKMVDSTAVICILALIACVSCGDLPADVPKCAGGDTACVAKTITDILHRFPKGNSGFGLQPVDNVPLENVVISRAVGGTPVQLDFKFLTVNLQGIEKANIERVVGFEEDLSKSKFEVYGLLPNLLLKGKYETNGRVLLLPIVGKGNAELKLTNVKFGFKVKVAEEIRNGKRHGVVTKVKTILEPGGFHIRLENLFDGNKELGDGMNDVINNNWKDLWSELQDGINAAMSETLKNLMVNVLQSLAYDDFYKKD